MSIKSKVTDTLKRRKEAKQRRTWTVSTDSRHFKLYKLWRDRGGANPNGYRENFCHYWRVVVLWAPLRYFLYTQYKDKVWLRPSTIIGTALVGFGTLLAALIWPLTFLQVVLTVAGGAAFIALFLGGAYVIEQNQRQIKRFFARVFGPIGKVLSPVGRILDSYILRPGLWFFDWFFLAGPKMHVIAPWSVFVTAVYLGLVIAWPVTVLTATVIALAFLGAVAAVLYLCSVLYEMYSDWSFLRKGKKRNDGIVKLTGAYMISKKHGICPFVEFDQPFDLNVVPQESTA